MEARLALLQTILSDGHIRSEIVDQFGVKSLEDSQTHFLSLLYFLGMLTLGASPRIATGPGSRRGGGFASPRRTMWALCPSG